jgi:hypothetical protein
MLAREDELPYIFPDAAGERIGKSGVEEPVAVPDILGVWLRLYAFAGEGELRTAGLCEDRRDFVEGEQLAPRFS